MAELQLPDSGLKEMFLLLLRQRKRFTVTGNSMLPLLKPGDQVLINPHAYRFHLPTPGDIVIAAHPYRTDVRLVKQVRSGASGKYTLEGLNAKESTDSRTLGSFTKAQLLGKVTSLFHVS